MENSSIEGFLIELNLKNKQWLVCCSYNQYPIYISDHLSSIRSNLDLFSGNHTNTFLMGYGNVELNDFRNLYSLKSLAKVPTYFYKKNICSGPLAFKL